jgi:two-component system, LytTR family, response regulator
METLLLTYALAQKCKYDTINHNFNVHSNGDYLKNLDLNDILFIKAESNYSFIYFRQNLKILTSRTLKYWNAISQNPAFVRIHRSNIINSLDISYVSMKESYIELSNGEKLAISRSCKRSFKRNKIKFI